MGHKSNEDNTKLKIYTCSAFLLCSLYLFSFLVPPAETQRIGFVSRNPNDVKFYLFRNPADNEEKHEIQFENDESLFRSGYNKSLPLILLIHGVLSNHLTISDVQQVKDAYLAQNFPANLIMVDYGELTVSRLPFLLSPLSIITLLLGHGNTDIVAKRVAEFVLFLMKSDVLSGPENIHIVGFSLGSHIAGTVGRHVFEKTNRKINRISGLDPSPQLPLNTIKLDQGDAEFIDVTLTSLGAIATVFREGHVQFYMNGGGPHQPNCPNFAPATETYCSHTTAVFYFAKSIKRRNIKACECGFTCRRLPLACQNEIVYGEYVPRSAKGKYYVQLD